MTFGQSVKLCLGQQYLFKFRGRAPRSEYWWFMLFIFLANCVCAVFFIFPPALAASLNLLVSLGLLPANLGVTVRRLHDRGLSGWWLLVPLGLLFFWTVGGAGAQGFITSVLSLAVSLGFLVILCMPGQAGPNRFGPDPLAAGFTAVQ